MEEKEGALGTTGRRKVRLPSPQPPNWLHGQGARKEGTSASSLVQGGPKTRGHFFSNPSRKFDVTSGPKNQDFLLRTAEKN